MALSVIHFRMHHGNIADQITFSGNGIKLLDLKKEILEKKNISGSLDFDLKITDDSGRVYMDDDDVVPKNASLVVKKLAVINSSASLISRLNNRGYAKNAAMSSQYIKKGGTDIVMPMKAEEEVIPASTSVNTSNNVSSVINLSAPSSALSTMDDDEDVMKLLEEDETVLVRTQPVSLGMTQHNESSLGAVNKYGAKPHSMSHMSTYKCPRCGKIGHREKFCPTIGDPSFDPYIGLANVPKAGRKKVSSLEGVDTSQNTVVQLKDGTYELFESSSTGRDILLRDADTHLSSNIDATQVPSYLKCAFSSSILKDAVSLPCCKKIVSDSVIRIELIRSGLKCPLCQAAGISPDSLVVSKDIRAIVDDFIQTYGRTTTSSVISDEASSSSTSDMNSSSTMLSFNRPQLNTVEAMQQSSITIQAKPPPPTTERPVVIGLPEAPPAAPTTEGMLSIQPNPLPVVNPALMGPQQPMHVGMMMMQPPPMMYTPAVPPTMGGVVDEIPPLEALPLPLSREEFEYEKKLQIALVNERGGFSGRGGYHQGRGYAGRGYPGRGYQGRGYPGRTDSGRGRGRWSSYRGEGYERDDHRKHAVEDDDKDSRLKRRKYEQDGQDDRDPRPVRMRDSDDKYRHHERSISRDRKVRDKDRDRDNRDRDDIEKSKRKREVDDSDTHGYRVKGRELYDDRSREYHSSYNAVERDKKPERDSRVADRERITSDRISRDKDRSTVADDRHNEKLRDKDRSGDKDRDKDRSGDKSRDKDRTIDKERDKDRSVITDKNRDKDRSTDKERVKERSTADKKDRSAGTKDREKDRSDRLIGDKDRDKGRSGDTKIRSTDKEHDKDRSDRDKDRTGIKDKDRSGDKDKDRSGDKDKDRSGDKVRSSDKDRDKDRSTTGKDRENEHKSERRAREKDTRPSEKDHDKANRSGDKASRDKDRLTDKVTESHHRDRAIEKDRLIDKDRTRDRSPERHRERDNKRDQDVKHEKRAIDSERDNRDRHRSAVVATSRADEQQQLQGRSINDRLSSDQRTSRGQPMDVEMIHERSVQYQDRDASSRGGGGAGGTRHNTSGHNSGSTSKAAVIPALKSSRNILSSQSAQSQNSSGKSKRIVIIK